MDAALLPVLLKKPANAVGRGLADLTGAALVGAALDGSVRKKQIINDKKLKSQIKYKFFKKFK